MRWKHAVPLLDHNVDTTIHFDIQGNIQLLIAMSMLFYDMLYTWYYSVSGKVYALHRVWISTLCYPQPTILLPEKTYLAATCTYVLFLCKRLFGSTFPTQTPGNVALYLVTYHVHHGGI